MEVEPKPEDNSFAALMSLNKWLWVVPFCLVATALILNAFVEAPRSATKNADDAKLIANALPQHMQDDLKAAIEEEREYQNWKANEAARHARAVAAARCKNTADVYADALNRCGVSASQRGENPLIACKHVMNSFTGSVLMGEFNDCSTAR